MTESLGFEYDALHHYLHKGIFARAGLISVLIKSLRDYSEKNESEFESGQFGLNKNEVLATLQLAIVSHIMMLIEDLAVICQSISEGNIDYYKYLDKSADQPQDLGDIIHKFYSEITKVSDETLSRILSYKDANAFEFVLPAERQIVSKISTQMIEKARAFLNKAAMFRENHIEIFRRYKHAGFPILLAQPLSSDLTMYKSFNFVSIALTSREQPERENVPLPYSPKTIESYENLKNDIFSFLGNVIHYKFICMERDVDGLIPNNNNLFHIILPESEKKVLDDVWKRFEAKFPVPKGQTRSRLATMSKILLWYVDIENTSKRVL